MSIKIDDIIDPGILVVFGDFCHLNAFFERIEFYDIFTVFEDA